MRYLLNSSQIFLQKEQKYFCQWVYFSCFEKNILIFSWFEKYNKMFLNKFWGICSADINQDKVSYGRERKFFSVTLLSCFEKNILMLSWFENIFLKSRNCFSISFGAFALRDNNRVLKLLTRGLTLVSDLPTAFASAIFGFTSARADSDVEQWQGITEATG